MAEDPWAGFETIEVKKPTAAAEAPVKADSWSQFEEVVPGKPKAEDNPAKPSAPIFDRNDPRFKGQGVESAKFLEGLPGVGSLVPKAGAAISALAHPLTGVGAPGESVSERYDRNLRDEDAALKAMDAERPITSTLLKAGGGIAGVAPLIAAAPAAFGMAGGRLLPSMAAGATSGGLIGAGDAYMRGEDPTRGAMFGAGGGAAGPALGRMVGRALEGAGRSQATNELADAAARQGVEFPMAAATESLPVLRAAGALKEIPIIGDPIVKASRKASEQMGDALGRVEQGFGTGSPFNAGDVAKTGITDWITGKSKGIMDRLYGVVDSAIAPNVTRPLDATRGMIANIASERFKAGLPGNGKAIETVFDAVQRPGGLGYEGTKTLRTAVGEMLDNSLLPADISRTELKRIYGALTIDLKDTVRQAGTPAALKAFERANNINKLVAQRREALAKIVGIEGEAAPEKVVDRLIAMANGNARADIQKLALARKAIGGKNWDEVASAAVARIGRDAEGNFSPDRFLTAYGKISPSGKTLLFGSTGKSDLASALNDIATLSSRSKQLASHGNPSGTGKVLGGLSILGAGIASPLMAIPAAIGGRLTASFMARSLKPSTMRVIQSNPQVRELVEKMVSGGVTGGAIGARPASPQQISPPSQQPIPQMMPGG